MNLRDAKYKDFALVREMLETPGIIERFDFDQSRELSAILARTGRKRLFLTGEGSSRIFPAKNLIYRARCLGADWDVFTEGARQAHEYIGQAGHSFLADCVVIGASNSGKTKEVISLFSELQKRQHPHRYGLTATPQSPLEALCSRCFVLSCGKENAVAATKSVVEQALFYSSILRYGEETPDVMPTNQQRAARAAREVLEAELDAEIIDWIAAAPVIYFAGRNNGVAEELTLKTNEITRKKSDYLEGTYAVHGIEEVMEPEEVVIAIDPFPEEMEKFRDVLVAGVGLKVIAVSSRPTIFPTIPIPDIEGYETVLQLLAGWNILVHVGVRLGVNLDKAQRARKIGNEFLGQGPAGPSASAP